jgi:hypothetical protein
MGNEVWRNLFFIAVIDSYQLKLALNTLPPDEKR